MVAQTRSREKRKVSETRPSSPRSVKRAKTKSGRQSSIRSHCDTDSKQGILECKSDMCAALREQRVPEIRALAKMLGVPQYSCLRKEDLCDAIDRQIVTYFALQDFVAGSKRLRDMVQELSQKAGNNGENLKLDAKQASRMASSLLTFVLLLLEKYNEMFELAMTSHSMSHEKRNEKLIATGTETIVYLRAALLGIGGSFVDASMFRR